MTSFFFLEHRTMVILYYFAIMTKACPYGVNTERPCLANGIVRELLKHCCPLLPIQVTPITCKPCKMNGLK